jgi:hypothetical protein
MAARSLLAIIPFLAAPGFAQIVPVAPDEFGPGAPTETFENYGDDLNQGGFGDLQVPDLFQLDSGARFLNLGAEDFGSIVDWSVSENTGWGLSLDGGDINFGKTTIPSGVAFFGYSELGSLFGFEFAQGVSRVGSYFEAAIFEGVYTGEIKVEAFDQGGASLGFVTAQSDGVLDDASLDSWVGLGTADGSPSIARVIFYGDVIVLDDMRFEVVPAPGAATLLAAAGAWNLRRRRARG